MNNVFKLPPPKRYCVEDYLNDQEIWDWKIIDVTGNEALIYIEGEDDPWAGETLDKIMKRASEFEYGYHDDDLETIKAVNLKILNEATRLRHNLTNSDTDC